MVASASPLLRSLVKGMYFMTFPSGELVGSCESSAQIPHAAHVPSQVQTFKSFSMAQRARQAILDAVSRMDDVEMVIYLHSVGVWPSIHMPLDPWRINEQWLDILGTRNWSLDLAIHQVVRVGITTKLVAR